MNSIPGNDVVNHQILPGKRFHDRAGWLVSRLLDFGVALYVLSHIFELTLGYSYLSLWLFYRTKGSQDHLSTALVVASINPVKVYF